jgi:hypothetical protein
MSASTEMSLVDDRDGKGSGAQQRTENYIAVDVGRTVVKRTLGHLDTRTPRVDEKDLRIVDGDERLIGVSGE